MNEPMRNGFRRVLAGPIDVPAATSGLFLMIVVVLPGCPAVVIGKREMQVTVTFQLYDVALIIYSSRRPEFGNRRIL